MDALAMVEGQESVERRGAGTLHAIQQVAITAVFTFTCYTVPVVLAGGADPSRQGDDATPAEQKAAEPSWAGGAIAEQVKELKTRFRAEQEALVLKYREALKSAGDASREERDRMRANYRLAQADLVLRQKELKEDLKARLAQFKTEHPDLQQAIEAAKETAQKRSRARRGTAQV